MLHTVKERIWAFYWLTWIFYSLDWVISSQLNFRAIFTVPMVDYWWNWWHKYAWIVLASAPKKQFKKFTFIFYRCCLFLLLLHWFGLHNRGRGVLANPVWQLWSHGPYHDWSGWDHGCHVCLWAQEVHPRHWRHDWS